MEIKRWWVHWNTELVREGVTTLSAHEYFVKVIRIMDPFGDGDTEEIQADYRAAYAHYTALVLKERGL